MAILTTSEAVRQNYNNGDRDVGNPVRRVPFTKSHASDEEILAVISALKSNRHAGNGPRTAACQKALELLVPGTRALITQSCTAALEMAALLINIGPGDEVIMPSWTFASSANAIVLRGGVPVFVDVSDDTLNIDPNVLTEAINARTRAIMCVHYAGVACDMDILSQICKDHNLILIEDAAQAVGSTWRGRPLGGIGDFGAYSFHATKNISCGEGGALLINDDRYLHPAEIIWEKGTNRLQYVRGEVNSYDWIDKGSSFLPSEITASLLEASLRSIDEKTSKRLEAWNYYHNCLYDLQESGYIKLPFVPDYAKHNGHVYHIRYEKSDELRNLLEEDGISVSPHYRPLHLSTAGKRYGRLIGEAIVTEQTSKSLLRLPLFPNISAAEQDFVVNRIRHWVTNSKN